MKRILLALVLSFNLLAVQARPFDERLHLEVLNYDGKTLSMKVTEGDDDLPKSTVLYAKVFEHKPNRRFMRSEYIKADLTEAVFPNGTSKNLNRKLKVRTKRFGGRRAIGNGVIGTTGLVLGITIDFLAVGLPVARGGLALWNAGYNIHEKDEDQSAIKEGAKGFIKGALFPLPQLVLKSKRLNLKPGSEVVLLSADADDQVKGIARAL